MTGIDLLIEILVRKERMKRYLLIYTNGFYKIVEEDYLIFSSLEPAPLIIIELTDNLVNEIIGDKK